MRRGGGRLLAITAVGAITAIHPRIGAAQVAAPLVSRDPARRDLFEVVLTLGTLAHRQEALNAELRKNGFTETGTAWPALGWGIALSAWRCRFALELAEARTWSYTLRRAQDGATARAAPTLDAFTFGYEVYVSRFLSIIPTVGVAWGGVTIDFDPKAPPLAPSAWSQFQTESQKTVDSLAFAARLGLTVEQFFPLVDPRRALDPGTPALVLSTRFGYQHHFAEGAWLTKYGDSTNEIHEVPAADVGGLYFQMAIGFAFAREKYREPRAR